MMLFLNSHGLGYTVKKQSTNPVNIISEDKTILARIHTPQVVADHERACTFLLEETVDGIQTPAHQNFRRIPLRYQHGGIG